MNTKRRITIEPITMTNIEKTKKKLNTTQELLRPSLILAQLFAMLPVIGITGNDYRTLKFHWFTMRSFYTILYLALLSTNITVMIVVWLEGDADFSHFVDIVFFTSSLLTTMLFVSVAKDWPYIMKKWYYVDKSMNNNYGLPKNLRIKLNSLTIIVMTAATVEHALSLLFFIMNMNTKKSDGILRQYFESNFSHIFVYVPYSILMGFLMQILIFFSTFTWNYMDLFIMLISTSIAERFRQINDRIKSSTFIDNRTYSQRFWKEIREDYNKLSSLCETVDESISNIILLSFANNLFFILKQLLNSLDPPKGWFFERFYYNYSFLYLVGRTIAVSLICSRIDAESKEPMKLFYTLDGYDYNVEVERLLMHIKLNSNALTGSRFFKVTKPTILSIAGAIVTYELIFIQFNMR